MIISKHTPVADGIAFDDTIGFDRDQLQLLKARRVVFLTKFKDADRDRWYGGRIIATDIDAARAVAYGRGLGEEVLGELF